MNDQTLPVSCLNENNDLSDERNIPLNGMAMMNQKSGLYEAQRYILLGVRISYYLDSIFRILEIS